MNRFFSLEMYKEALRKLKLPGVFAMALIVIQSLFIPVIVFLGNIEYYLKYANEGTASTLGIEEAQMGLTLIAFLMPLMAMILFDFMNHRNSSDFFHSLPVSRSGMFSAFVAAVLSWCLGLVLFSTALTSITYLLIPGMQIDYTNCFAFIRNFWTLGFYITCVMILARCLAGTKITICASALYIVFFPRAVTTFIYEVVSDSCSYVLMDEESILWNNNFNVVWGFLELFELEDDVSGMIVYSTVISIIFLAIAGVLFVRRKSEKAEDVAINPLLQRVFSFIPVTVFCFYPCMGIISIYLGEETFDGSTAFILLLLYAIAYLVYFLYELLTVRRFAALKKAAKYAWVLVVINIVLVVGICSQISIVKNQRPAKDEIDYVYLTDFDNAYPASVEKKLAKIKITDPEVLEYISKRLNESCDGKTYINVVSNKVSVTIHYNGINIYRRLSLDFNYMESLLEKDPQFVELLYTLPDVNELSSISAGFINKSDVYFYDQTEKKKIMEVLEQEMMNVTPAQWNEMAQYYTYPEGENDKTIVLCLGSYREVMSVGTRKDACYSLYVLVDKNIMPETYELLYDKIQNAVYDEEVDYEYDEVF